MASGIISLLAHVKVVPSQLCHVTGHTENLARLVMKRTITDLALREQKGKRSAIFMTAAKRAIRAE